MSKIFHYKSFFLNNCNQNKNHFKKNKQNISFILSKLKRRKQKKLQKNIPVCYE